MGPNPTLPQPQAQTVPIPAQMLEGLLLANGWKVVRKFTPAPGATGSSFSVGYEVRKATGEQGFLKALDFVSQLQWSSDAARDLQAMTEAFNFERDILEACRRMSRVVTAIEQGSVTVPGIPLGTVQYLIFELAEGDARSQMDASLQFDLVWALRTLHHVAVGLFQMHRGDVAHQDLKPSNVLVFEKGASAKIADLGRAASRGLTAPHDGLAVAGDPTYAPPEMLYGEPPTDWNARRLGCDVYHLGSMIVFFFAKAAMTPALLHFLHPAHSPPSVGGEWGGTYAEALPHVRAAFEQAVNAVEQAIDNLVGANLRPELVALVRQLCDPDPALRGHPRNRGRSVGPLALERYVAKLNVLVGRAEAELRKRL